MVQCSALTRVRDSPVSFQGSPQLSASTTGFAAAGDAADSEGIAFSLNPSALYCYTTGILHTALKLHDMSRFKRRRNEERLFHETVSPNCKYGKFVTQDETHMTPFQPTRFTEGSWNITTRLVCTLIQQFVKNQVIYNITCKFSHTVYSIEIAPLTKQVTCDGSLDISKAIEAVLSDPLLPNSGHENKVICHHTSAFVHSCSIVKCQ